MTSRVEPPISETIGNFRTIGNARNERKRQKRRKVLKFPETWKLRKLQKLPFFLFVYLSKVLKAFRNNAGIILSPDIFWKLPAKLGNFRRNLETSNLCSASLAMVLKIFKYNNSIILSRYIFWKFWKLPAKLGNFRRRCEG